jgi:hypothetical protein
MTATSTSKITAVDQPNDSTPFIAVIGPSSRQRSVAKCRVVHESEAQEICIAGCRFDTEGSARLLRAFGMTNSGVEARQPSPPFSQGRGRHGGENDDRAGAARRA